MNIGYTLLGSTTSYYGPWSARHGNAATFTLQVITITGSSTLDVAIETKNRDQADSLATSVASFTQITAAGTSDKQASGLKELVRLKHTVGGAGSFRAVSFDVPNVAWERN